ncbi:MAG: replication-associated recombination protein A [Syntrophobacterales bacterium]|nr:MAG: replication-associated recombination protein A [Syntrophobacterales bacterium]
MKGPNRRSERGLFESQAEKNGRTSAPLADRMRPTSLLEIVGQDHLLGKGKPLRNAIEKDQISSMIFWGPPGSGKTTLARIIATATNSRFISFSAVLSGVKEIREVTNEAEGQRRFHHRRTILFVDEIHRFNKAQQDAFLPHVESGLLILIGATTENPSFEVISPLLSRTRVFTLQPLTRDQLLVILNRALNDEERGLGKLTVELETHLLDHIAAMADGDARIALNALEMAVMTTPPGRKHVRRITLKTLEAVMQRKALLYDKNGEEHYNLISALHKSLRGGDPDAALYWLGRMLEAGEDPLYIARRMVRFASEDIGNADPQALQVAVSAMQAFNFVGLPEGNLALAQAAVYLATAPKSNALYTAYRNVQKDIQRTLSLSVPLHLRNAPTKLMKELGYGKGYKYPHDFPDHFVEENYLPKDLKGRIYYRPTNQGFEGEIRKRLDKWRKGKG